MYGGIVFYAKRSHMPSKYIHLRDSSAINSVVELEEYKDVNAWSSKVSPHDASIVCVQKSRKILNIPDISERLQIPLTRELIQTE